MKLISRYIVKEFLPPFIYSIIAFTSLYIIVDLFDTLDETLRYNVSIFTLAKYYTFFTPTILVNVIPLSILLAVFYVIKNFNKHNEIIAMRMGGISLFKLIRPFIALGLIISAVVMFINEFLAPQSLYWADTLRKTKMRTKNPQKKTKQQNIENLAFIGNDNCLYYVGKFNLSQKRIDSVLIIKYDRQKILRQKIAAAYAVWEKKNWLFYDGIIYTYTSGSLPPLKTAFKKKIFNLRATPQELTQYKNQTDYLNSFELKSLINKFSKEDKKIRNRLLVDFYYKLSFPFISFMILLFSIPLALLRSRSGALISVGASILIGISFYTVLSISIAFGKGEILPPFTSAWLANILFGGIGILLTLILHK